MPPFEELPPPLQQLQSEVDAYMEELFANTTPRRIRQGKIFRDAVFGYFWFHPHECVIIDSPLLQRLRYIHQTALAYEVYHSANHTRFEHSLGVAVLAGRIVEAIGRVGDGQVNQNDIYEVRLAGLLHDVGHALFSHLSESIMGQKFEVRLRAVRSTKYFRKRSIKFGELFSFLMVRSRVFQSFWEDVRTFYPHLQIDLNKVSWLIVGEATSAEKYKADIISGPFDADKLDYFGRDSHFTGIKAELDIERILYTVKVLNLSGHPRMLVMRRGGVPHLEQILISKMMLYSSVYHHHKVRTMECMIRGVFETIWDDPSAINDSKLRFSGPMDFFRVSEAAFFVKGLEEPAISSQIDRILRRDALQRSLIINPATVRRGDGSTDKHRKLRSLAERVDAAAIIRKVREQIFSELSTSDQTCLQDLWLDLPATPALSEDAEQCLIEMEPGVAPVPLRSLFPSDEWVAAYGDNKWTGHVFYVADDDTRRRAGETAKAVLSDMFELEFIPSAIDNSFKGE